MQHGVVEHGGVLGAVRVLGGFHHELRKEGVQLTGDFAQAMHRPAVYAQLLLDVELAGLGVLEFAEHLVLHQVAHEAEQLLRVQLG